MRYWQAFWTASLLVAGASFAGITAVVTVRGFRDLGDLFSRLRRQRDDQSERP
jgi:hypothetical protein